MHASLFLSTFLLLTLLLIDFFSPSPMKDLPLCFTQSYFAKMKYKKVDTVISMATQCAIFNLISQLSEECTADNDTEQTA